MANWSFPLTLYPPPCLPKFLSVKAARDLPWQGGALQPAETNKGRSILLCQIRGSTKAKYFPDGYLLCQVLCGCSTGETCFTKSAATLANSCIQQQQGLSISPSTSSATSPWYYPERNRDTIHPLLLSGMGWHVFPLPLCALHSRFPRGSGRTILALFPLSDLALGLTCMSGCIICTGRKRWGCSRA